MSPVIGKKSAQWLLGIVRQMDGAEASRVLVDLKHALRLRPGLKLAKVRRVAKKATKKEKTADVRSVVMERSDGVCESCGRLAPPQNPLEHDHFLGRARSESVETSWAIHASCHRAKTLNVPSAEFWLESFARHAESHGYSSEAGNARRRLESLKLQAEACL